VRKRGEPPGRVVRCLGGSATDCQIARRPVHAGAALWYTDGIREYIFEITSWRLNGADAPKRDEFAKPEDRPGWEVCECSFRKKK
jgi:hypothetical protein